MTKCSRYQWECRVVALCPLNVRVDAVYYWGEDPEDISVNRIPQVALALCEQVQFDTSTDEETDAPREIGILKYIDAEFEESAQYFADTAKDSFLGYEFNGAARTWAKAINDIWERKEKTKALQALQNVTA